MSDFSASGATFFLPDALPNCACVESSVYFPRIVKEVRSDVANSRFIAAAEQIRKFIGAHSYNLSLHNPAKSAMEMVTTDDLLPEKMCKKLRRLDGQELVTTTPDSVMLPLASPSGQSTLSRKIGLFPITQMLSEPSLDHTIRALLDLSKGKLSFLVTLPLITHSGVCVGALTLHFVEIPSFTCDFTNALRWGSFAALELAQGLSMSTRHAAKFRLDRFFQLNAPVCDVRCPVMLLEINYFDDGTNDDNNFPTNTNNSRLLGQLSELAKQAGFLRTKWLPRRGLIVARAACEFPEYALCTFATACLQVCQLHSDYLAGLFAVRIALASPQLSAASSSNIHRIVSCVENTLHLCPDGYIALAPEFRAELEWQWRSPVTYLSHSELRAFSKNTGLGFCG